MSRELRLIKKYRKYKDQSTGRKFYRPTYRGFDIIFSQIPTVLWQYDRAEEAQEHAERHEVRKRLQIARFQDEDYRTAILTRYALLLLIKEAEQQERK